VGAAGGVGLLQQSVRERLQGAATAHRYDRATASAALSSFKADCQRLGVGAQCVGWVRTSGKCVWRALVGPSSAAHDIEASATQTATTASWSVTLERASSRACAFGG